MVDISHQARALHENHMANNRGANSSSRSSGKRGFAAMDAEKQRRIASMGGKASHGSRGSSSNRKSGNR